MSKTRLKEQFDVLVYHFDGPEEEACYEQLLSIVKKVEDDVGEEIKIANIGEHFATGDRFDSMEDALDR